MSQVIHSILVGASLVLTQLFTLNVISDDKPSSVAIHMVYVSKTRNFYNWIFNVNFFFGGYFTLFPLSKYVYQPKVLKFIFFSFSSFFIRISMVMYLRYYWLQQSLMVVETALWKFNGKALTVQVRICTRQGAIYRTSRVTAYSVSEIKQNHNPFPGTLTGVKAWTGPAGSKRLSLPDFHTIGTWMWKSCQLYAPAALTPGNIPSTEGGRRDKVNEKYQWHLR